jgi:enoyl-CoA hydratase
MSFETIRYEVQGGVATVTIDRPTALNALNAQVLGELDLALQGFEADPSARVLVLTGGGNKAFVAGADIKEMAAMGPEEALAFSRRGHEVARRLAESRKTTIAAVGGFALGGGCEMALACDMIFCSENAKFGQPEVRLGVIPGFGGTQRLARAVGAVRAKFLVLTGETVGAEEARAMGLVVRVFPRDELLARVTELAGTIASKCGPEAVAVAKATIDEGLAGSLSTGLDLEAERFAALFAGDEQKEGMAAFIEKRPARFAD